MSRGAGPASAAEADMAPPATADRWPHWLRLLGVHAMPSLSAQAASLRKLLSSELPGGAESLAALEAEAHAATLTALGERAAALSPAAIERLAAETAFVLVVCYKRARLPFTPELPLAALIAPVVLFAVGHAAILPSDDAAAAELARLRSPLLNAVAALLAKLHPAVIAGAPWGLTPAGAPSGPPNMALLSAFSALLRWECPALGARLERGGRGVSARLMRSMSSLLATSASPEAYLTLTELALAAGARLPKAHPAYLLCSLLLSRRDALMSLSTPDLPAALGALTLTSAAQAEALHASACSVAAAAPSSVRLALAAAWCARPSAESQPLPCALLEPAEVCGGGGGGGGGQLSSVVSSPPPPPPPPLGGRRVWTVDLRPTAEFDEIHFALTLHLPPAEARSAEARQAALAQLELLCSEGDCALCLLTSRDPTSATCDSLAGGTTKGAAGGKADHPPPNAGGLTADELRLLIDELLGGGFARVGVLRGGFAGLNSEQRASLVVPSILPPSAADIADGENNTQRSRSSSVGAAAAAVGRIGSVARERLRGGIDLGRGNLGAVAGRMRRASRSKQEPLRRELAEVVAGGQGQAGEGAAG